MAVSRTATDNIATAPAGSSEKRARTGQLRASSERHALPYPARTKRPSASPP